MKNLWDSDVPLDFFFFNHLKFPFPLKAEMETPTLLPYWKHSFRSCASFASFPLSGFCAHRLPRTNIFQQASILHAVLNSAVVKHPGNNHHTWGKIPSDAMQNKSYSQNCQAFMEIDLCLLLQHSKKSLLALLGWHLWNLQNLKSTKEQPGRCR